LQTTAFALGSHGSLPPDPRPTAADFDPSFVP